MTNEVVDAYKNIPVLKGHSNFHEWEHLFRAFARRKNLITTLLGVDREPFRKTVAKGDGDYEVVRPPAERAGECPPTGRQLAPGQGQTLSEDDRAKWDKWAKTENPLRAALIETSLPKLHDFIDRHWTAHDAFEALAAKFQNDTIEHRRSAKTAVESLKLPDKPTPEELDDHMEEYMRLVGKSEKTGYKWQDFDKCDVLLKSIPASLSQYIESIWKTNCRATGADFDFESLESAYMEAAEGYRLRYQADPTINAAVMFNDHVNQGRPQKGKREGTNRASGGGGKKAKSDSDSDKENKGSKSKAKSSQTCGHCNRRFHTEKQCWEKKAGIPSFDEQRKLIAAQKEKAKPENDDVSDRGKQTKQSANHVNADSSSSSAEDSASTESDGDHGQAVRSLWDLDDNEEDFEDGVVMTVTGDDAEQSAQVTKGVHFRAKPIGLAPVIVTPTTTTSSYLVDSGAGVHIVNDLSLLTEPQPISKRFGHIGGGRVRATHVGSLHFKLPNGEIIIIKKVFYSPEAGLCLLSAGRLRKTGWIVDLNDDTMTYDKYVFAMEIRQYTSWTNLRLVKQLSGKQASRRRRKHTNRAIGVFHVDFELNSPLFQEHRRTGHLSRTLLMKLAKEGRLNITYEEAKEDKFDISHCFPCMQTGSKKLPKNEESPRGTALEREYVHADLFGPRTPTWHGYDFALVMSSDYTRVRHVELIKGKSGSSVFDPLTNFITKLERQTGCTVVNVRTDWGKEFVNGLFGDWCKRKGINHEYTEGYVPEHNAVAERVIGILKRKMQAMLAGSTIGPQAWGHAMQYAANILNMVTTSSVDGKTAWELMTGRKPNLQKVRTFGEYVFAHIPSEKRERKDNPILQSGRAARILGRDPNRPGWIIRFEDNGEINVSSDLRTAMGIPLDFPLEDVPDPTSILKGKAKSIPRILNQPDDPRDLLIPPYTPICGPNVEGTPTYTPASSRAPSAAPPSRCTTEEPQDAVPTTPTSPEPPPGESTTAGPPGEVGPEPPPGEPTNAEPPGEARTGSTSTATGEQPTNQHNIAGEAANPSPIPSITVHPPETTVAKPPSAGGAPSKTTPPNPTATGKGRQTSGTSTASRSASKTTTTPTPTPTPNTAPATKSRVPTTSNLPPKKTRARPTAATDGAPPSERRRSSRTPQPRQPATSYKAATSSKPPISAVLKRETAEFEILIAVVLESNPTTPDEPLTYEEAMQGPNASEWAKAWQAELDKLEEKGTWEEAVRPAGEKLIDTKPVFRLKTDADGNIKKFKARNVARGFRQVAGLHFNETHQPTSKASSLRLLLTLAASYNLEVHQADFEAAYLNADVDVPIYIRFPPGYKKKDPRSNCLLLKKSLYGLKQAGNLWWKAIEKELHDKGFEHVKNEWGLYVKREKGIPVAIIMLYVDDMICAARDANTIDGIFDALNETFPLTKLGEVNHILGLKVERDGQYFNLSQSAYIDSILKELPGINANIAKYAPLPLDPRPCRSGEESEEETPLSARAAKAYQEVLGKVLWPAIMTRPDIAFATSYLGRFSHAPSEHHWQLLLRVVNYLAHTRDVKLRTGGPPKALEAYCDSDWGDRDGTFRSTSGFVILINDSVINWSSRRQPTVALSSTEAEYIAASDTAREIIWWRALLKELGLEQHEATPLHMDNESARKLAHRPTNHGRTKHIDVKYHHIRDLIRDHALELERVNSEDNIADGLTKPLDGTSTAVMLSDLHLVRTQAAKSGECRDNTT